MIFSLSRWSTFILILFFSSSCGIYETKNPNNHAPRVDIAAILANPNSKVSFNQVSLGIFQVSCLQCHSSNQAKGGVVLETYGNIMTQMNDVITDIQSGDMPQSGSLSEEQINLFNLWIKQGAHEMGNDADPSPNETPIPSASPQPSATPQATATPVLTVLAPNYQSIRDNIFVPKCLKCHGFTGSKHSRFPLESYEQLMAQGEMIIAGNPSKSTVVKEIRAGTMPTRKSGLTKVTPEELKVIETWIAHGANQ
jgi:hypothetical protein